MRDALVDFTPADPRTRSAFLTYEPYYGLKEKAFSLSADPRFLYKSRAHAPMFDELRAGIRRREGIIVLTGEPGTGKTTLCRGVLAALDRKTFCAFVPDPFVSREDLLKMLLIEFGVLSVDDVRSGRLQAATRPELSYPLYDFLRSLVPLQAYAVLIIDEAQNLSSMLLEEIRILSDLEGPEKLLQLVLVGQPELRDKLKDPSMRQVDQRISVRCSLQPLGRDALPAYIAHRLTVAGGGADRVEFTPEALDLVYGASNGNPRLLNLIADKSLHRGHLDRTWTITPEVVTAALGDLGYDTPAPLPTTELAPELFLPEASRPEPPPQESADDGPHFLLEEARGRDVADAPPDARRRRAALLALLVTVGVALGALGVALNAWDARRQELVQLPAVVAPPPLPVSAGVAPVIPPAEFFASVRP
jgi:general secretion pathway protein A